MILLNVLVRDFAPTKHKGNAPRTSKQHQSRPDQTAPADSERSSTLDFSKGTDDSFRREEETRREMQCGQQACEFQLNDTVEITYYVVLQ